MEDVIFVYISVYCKMSRDVLANFHRVLKMIIKIYPLTILSTCAVYT